MLAENPVCNEICFDCEFDDCINPKKYLTGQKEQSDLIDREILGIGIGGADDEWHFQGKIHDKEVKEKLKSIFKRRNNL